MDAFDARWRRSPCSPRLALLHADRTHNDCATPATHSAKSAAEIAPACDYRDRFTEPPQGVADVKRTGRATRPPILDPAVVTPGTCEPAHPRHRQAPVAQWIEQAPSKRLAAGSSPAGGATDRPPPGGLFAGRRPVCGHGKAPAPSLGDRRTARRCPAVTGARQVAVSHTCRSSPGPGTCPGRPPTRQLGPGSATSDPRTAPRRFEPRSRAGLGHCPGPPGHLRRRHTVVQPIRHTGVSPTDNLAVVRCHPWSATHARSSGSRRSCCASSRSNT